MFLKLLLTTAAVATLALAQGGDMGGMGGGMQTGGRASGAEQNGVSGGGLGPNRAQKESKADMVSDKLKLSKDQKAEFESILEVSYQESGKARQALAQARADLANATLSGQPADTIAKLTSNFTTAQAAMTGEEVKAFQKIYALLKPNQTAHAPEAFDLMAGILDAPTGGRGMGRGRGGR